MGLKLDAISIDFGREYFKGCLFYKSYFSAWFKGLIELAYAMQAAGTATDTHTLTQKIVAGETTGKGRSLLDPSHSSMLRFYGIGLRMPGGWGVVERCAGC